MPQSIDPAHRSSRRSSRRSADSTTDSASRDIFLRASPTAASSTLQPSADATALLRQLATQTPQAALEALTTSPEGLTEADARERLARFGPNTVAEAGRRSVIRHFLSLLASPLSLLLLALAIINYSTGQRWSAVMIGIMVVLSSLLSFVQEHRSDRAAARLRAMVATTATVLRRHGTQAGRKSARRAKAADAAAATATPPPMAKSATTARQPAAADTSTQAVPLAQLVPGDIVQLSVGDLVPADVRILASKDLFISQASLTGESMPVERDAAALAGPLPAALLDLGNIAFMGTNVASGTATAVVAATGARTAFGHIAAAIASEREITSFDRGIDTFIWLILRFMLVMVPLVFLINGWTKGDWLEALLFAVAVAVGLTPEMLPMIITINLGAGALAMAQRKVIVKRLNAIQNVGAMDVLCTDKTGTLTQDKVILEKHVDIFGRDSEKVTEYAYLNSFHQTGLKNLLDKAVLKYVAVHERLQADSQFRKIDEIPFDFTRRRMSVIVERGDGTRILICKGAVEEVLAVCNRADEGGRTIPLAEHGKGLRDVVDGLNDDGFRVIAVAYREVPPDEQVFRELDEKDLVLVGYIAFLDPPKDSAAEAIRALHRRGITVKVLTGDNAAVTRNVCRHVGLADSRVLLGSDIDALDDAALKTAAEETVIFAKLTPQQKSRVIQALQAGGHVVGYLGDGINDGAALKTADVGISVDSAVDIAKESADIILLKKSLMALKDGVVEGRKVFGNISKYIKMSASSNFGNMLSVLGASALLPFLPMAPLQILLNNLLYDFSQTTVATDHVDAEYMQAPRRWDISGIGRFMLCMGPVSSLFDYATFAALWFGLSAGSAPATFQTGWFLESLLSQTLVVHIIRTGRIPFVESRPSLPLLVTTLSICLIGLWLPVSPFAATFGFVPMPTGWWVALPLLLVAYLGLAQAVKAWLIRRHGLG